MLMKRRTSCKSYLIVRLETCWKCLQTMLLQGEINLDLVVERLQKIGCLPTNVLHCHRWQSHLHYCRWCRHQSQHDIPYSIFIISLIAIGLFVCLRSQHIAIQLTYPRRDLSCIFSSPDWSSICTSDNSPL